MTTSIFPKNMLTDLTRAFMAPPDPKAMNDRFRTQAYVMSAAANRDRDMAAAEEYKAKTAEREARNQMRTPEAMQAAALAGMGLAGPQPDLIEAFRTGRNPVTPGQPAMELPSFDNSQTGNFDLASVMANPNISLETLAPATQPVERPVDPAQLRELAQRMGDLLGMNAATGDTNYNQLQQGRNERMKGDVLARVMRGEKVSPEELAAIGSSALYDSSGGRYTGEVSDSMRFTEGGRMDRERIQSGDRRYGDNTRAASSRYGTDVGAATSRANAALKGDKDAPDESEAINSIDLTVPYFRQVPKEDADYQQFLRIYNNAKQKGDQRTLRAVIHKALKHGIIQQGE